MPRSRKPAAPPPAAPPTHAVRRSPRLWLLLAGVALVALAAFSILHLRTRGQRVVAAAGVAARPDLRGQPEALAAALADAESRIFKQGNPADGLAQLATLYHANGYYAEAQQAYRTLRELQPREAKWLHRAAHLHATLGELPDALALWRQALERAPDYLPARIGCGEALLKSGDHTAAAAMFSTILARDPANVYAQLGLARIDVGNEAWPAAQPRLEAIANQTGGLLGADLLATVYERSGAPERSAALRASKKSHGLYVAPEDPWIDEIMDACYDTYRLALESGTAATRHDTARAERLILRALELDPNDANLNFHAGQQARQRGSLGSARSYLERAVRLDPALSDAWAALVAVQQQQGQAQAAAQTLSHALAANPESGVLWLERARAYKAQGRLGEAMDGFRRAAQLRHDDATASIELARILLTQDRIDEGIQVLEQGLAAEPGNPIALSILAFAAIQAQRQELADRCLRHIVEHPRVTAAERSRLFANYENTFGRAFSWAR